VTTTRAITLYTGERNARESGVLQSAPRDSQQSRVRDTVSQQWVPTVVQPAGYKVQSLQCVESAHAWALGQCVGDGSRAKQFSAAFIGGFQDRVAWL
jgi:hypothetical protein